MWELTPTFVDAGPLIFTLQVGKTANSDADDWEDVGLPVENQYFAVDDEQRVWGKMNWTFYRVKLETSLGTYYSLPVNGLGTLSKRDWRVAREFVRKEKLWHRLNFGSQEGYLLKRRWTGKKCPTCLDFQTDEVRNPECHTCFSGETLVRAESGFKPIAKIARGERVLTIDGSYQRVVTTMKRRYKGNAYCIRTTSMTRPVIATPDHPFYALTSSHVFRDVEQSARYGYTSCGPSPCDVYMSALCDALYRETGANFHAKSRTWRAKSQNGGLRGGGAVTLGYFPTKAEAQQVVFAHREKRFDLGHRLDWVDAQALDSRHWLDTVWPSTEQDVLTIEAPVATVAGRRKIRPRLGATRFTVDEEFLWVVGMYIAEGCPGTRGILFALHRDETAYRDRLVRFFEAHGFHPRVAYPHGLGMNIHVASTTLCEWFPRWLGSGSHNKRIPEEFMRLPAEKTWAIIQGVWDGDGTKDTNEVGQTSEVLALQLAELLHRVGKQPTIYKMRKKPGKKDAWVTSWEEPTLKHNNRKGRWHFDGRLLARINSYERIDYDGYVYNLEVEGNHTYVVQNIVAHNCYGTGFLCGYYYPMSCVWASMDPRSYRTELDGGQGRGTINDITVKARMLNTVLLSEDDVYVSKKTDDRYYIHRVTNRSEVRGIALIADVELRPLAFSDVVYEIQIPQQLEALAALTG